MQRLIYRTLIPVTEMILLMIVCMTQVSAGVMTTTEPTGAADAVYVAGNPDFYPIEYYDEESGSYEGIMPEMLEKVSEKTGMDFVYVSGGNKNRQKNLAENRQVEMVSAHEADREIDWDLQDDLLLFRVEREKENVEVYTGFTRIASNDLITKVQKALEEICREDLSGIAVSYVMEQKEQHFPKKVLLIVLTAVILLSAGLLIYIFRLRKKNLQQEKNEMDDPLTGLGNAGYLEYQFGNLLSVQEIPLYYLAYIGIHNMEQIRQYQGEEELGTLQKYIASVISQGTGDAEVPVRLNDGEFAVLFQNGNDADAGKRIEMFMDSLKQYPEQFSKDYKPELHAGIYHLKAEKKDFEMAVFCAKQGYLYAVKYGLAYAFGNQKVLNDAKEKALLKRELQDAIKNREFQLYLQFVVDKNTKKICGAEALSRWQNPRQGILNPGKYVGLMHEAGIIEKLDFYICEEACKQLEEWKRQGLEELWISCNFTRTAISTEHFPETFQKVVEKYEFRHDRLRIEITEDSLAENDALIRRNIAQCSKMGFFIVLDDFGSGYSSLMDLCDYPLDCVKIDRSIVIRSVEPRGMELLSGICRLAHEMKMHVLCEGVETEEENSRIGKLSCEYIQGYYYSRVFPKEHAMEYYEKYMSGLK